MSLHETPMIEKYWDQVGGTLIEEIYAGYGIQTNRKEVSFQYQDSDRFYCLT